jgi:hypothetical protein
LLFNFGDFGRFPPCLSILVFAFPITAIPRDHGDLFSSLRVSAVKSPLVSDQCYQC